MEETDKEEKLNVPIADDTAEQYRVDLSGFLEGIPSQSLIYQAEGLFPDKQPNLDGFIEKIRNGERLNKLESTYIADLLSGKTSYKLTFRKVRGNKKRINEFAVLSEILSRLSTGDRIEKAIDYTAKKFAAAHSTVEKIEKRGGEILAWYPMMKKGVMAKARELRRENLRTRSS